MAHGNLARDDFPMRSNDRSTFAGLSRRDWCVVLVAVIVASLPAVMPAMVAAMAAQPQIGTGGAGYLVSINMAGLFCGTVLSALVQDRRSSKWRIVTGLLVMMAGNVATMAVDTFTPLLAARLVSGIGEGLAAGACFSLMAGAVSVGRAFGFYTAGQGVIGAIGMGTLPWLVAAFDWRAFYAAMTVIALPALLLAHVAADDATTEATGKDDTRISGAGWISLAVIFVFFTGMALVWAFLQRIGELHGLPLLTISGALASAALVGMAGSLCVALGGDRLSDRNASLIGMLMVGAAAAGLWSSLPTAYLLGAWSLNFVWGFQYPFLFRMLARTDPGKGAAVTPMASGIALSAGPALGGQVLARAGVDAACLSFLALTLGALAISLLHSGRSSNASSESV